MLFDVDVPHGILFPSDRVLREVLEELNAPALASIWSEDETLGWVYQYFTPKELRDEARKASSSPRNANELAFRNQFYTPRYVVEFLVDNTLGRTWYEMRHGDTALAEQCRYMVRRADEVFLGPESITSDMFPADTDFIMGRSDTLDPFKVPVVEWTENKLVDGVIHPGYSSTDGAGLRLLEFAHHVRSFRWMDDERAPIWNDMIPALCTGNADDPVEGGTQDLWDLMFAAARAGHFGDEVMDDFPLTFTRIANEVRRRLLASREPGASAADQLKATHLVRFREKRDPRKLRILDPACGSGHFLLYCFDLLETIYKEAWDDPDLDRTLRRDFADHDSYLREIPCLILQHNLHGIDIDLRAVQIAQLVLWLRAQRAYATLGIRPSDRPPVTRVNVVAAEPLPGEREMLREFVSSIEAQTAGRPCA